MSNESSHGRSFAFVRKHRPDIVILLLVVILFAVVVGVQHVFKDDALQYEMMVKVFRGSASLEDVEPAFRNRVLIPLLASVLPFGPRESMQIVNFFFAVCLGAVFFRYLRTFSFDAPDSLLGVALLLCSVPFGYYGTQALTDVSALFFIVLPLYLIRTRTMRAVSPLLISLGVLSRETVVFVLPVLLYYVARYEKKRAMILVLCLLPFVSMFSVRYLVSLTIAPASGATDFGYLWMPSLDLTIINVERILSLHRGIWLTVLPLLPFLVTAFPRRHGIPLFPSDQREFLLVTCVFMSMLTLYGLTAAHFDPRFIWILFPVLVPLCLKGYSYWSGIRGLAMVKRIVDRVTHTLV